MSGALWHMYLKGWWQGQLSNLGLREDKGVLHEEPQGNAPCLENVTIQRKETPGVKWETQVSPVEVECLTL